MKKHIDLGVDKIVLEQVSDDLNKGYTQQHFEMFMEYFSTDISLKELGKKYGLSGARMHQIILQMMRKVRLSLRERFQALNEFENKKKLHEEGKRIKKGEKPIIKITDAIFPRRVINCLKAADIHTLNELAKRGPEVLLEFRNFGLVSLNQIRLVLRHYKLID